MKCDYCSNEDELRPYGENGAMICFDCAFATPERAATTEKNFLNQMNACGESIVVIGAEAGPFPMGKRQ